MRCVILSLFRPARVAGLLLLFLVLTANHFALANNFGYEQRDVLRRKEYTEARAPKPEPKGQVTPDGIYLWQAFRAIPEAFSHYTPFELSPVEVSTRMRRVTAELERAQTNAMLEGKRTPPVSLVIENPKAGNGIAMVIDPKELDRWKSSIIERFRRFDTPRGAKLATLIKKAIATKDSEALAAFGAIQVLWEITRGDGKNYANYWDIIDRLRAIDEGDLDLFIEPEQVLPALKTVLNEDPEIQAVQLALTHSAETLSQKRVKSVQKIYRKVRIQELDPEVAAFRGWFGNDCSTLFSCFYSLSPLERNYYIYDEETGEDLGYMAMSQVEFQGKRAMYFHTIAGQKVTRDLADMVLSGVYHSLKLYGAEEMVVPTARRVHENINYHPIAEAFLKLVGAGQEGSMVYEDVPAREHLDRESRGAPYDLIANNRAGFRVSAAPLAVQVSEVKDHPLLTHSSEIPTRGHGLVLVAQALAGKRDRAGWEAARAFGLNDRDVKAFQEVLKNPDKLTKKEFFASIEKALQAEGAGDPASLLAINPSFYMEGWLNCPDALSPENAETTVHALLSTVRLRAREEAFQSLGQIAFTQKDLIVAQPAFQHAVESATQGEPLQHFLQMVQEGRCERGLTRAPSRWSDDYDDY